MAKNEYLEKQEREREFYKEYTGILSERYLLIQFWEKRKDPGTHTGLYMNSL